MSARRISDETYWSALDEASTAKDVLRAATRGAGWEKRRRPFDGATPWMAVLEKGFQSETMPKLCKRMFEKGIDFTTEDKFGRTFWAWALHYGIEEPGGTSKVTVQVEIPYMEPVSVPDEAGNAVIHRTYVLVGYTWLDMLQQKMPSMCNRAGEGVLVQMASHHPEQANWSMALAHFLEELRGRVPNDFAFSQDDWLGGTPERQAAAGQLLFEISLRRISRPLPNSTNAVRTRTSRGLSETLGAFPIVESTLKSVDPTLATGTRLANLLNTWSSNDPNDSQYDVLREALMAHAPVSWWESGALKEQFSGGFAQSRGWTAWVDSMTSQMRAQVLDGSLPNPHARTAKPRF